MYSYEDRIRAVELYIKHRPRLFRGQDGCLSLADGVPWSPHRAGRVRGDDLTHHQPIEQYTQGSQMLLDRRGR